MQTELHESAAGLMRGNKTGRSQPPVIDVHECKSRTRTQRAVTLAEELIRAMGSLPASAGDWEDAVDYAGSWVNDNGRDCEETTSIDEVLPIVAQRSRLSYWDWEY